MKAIKPKHFVRSLLEKELEGVARGAPRCRHFGECGGCEFQDIGYPEQATVKTRALQALIRQRGLAEVIAPEGIETVSSPCAYGYRQRMDYVFAFERAGLRRRRTHRSVVQLEECPLLGERGFAAFTRARDLAHEHGLQCYNYLRHQGYLRYFVVRQSRDGQILLSLVTKSREHEPEIAKIAQTLLAEGCVKSVYWLVHEGLSDLSFGEIVKYYGAEYIFEEYFGKRFLLGPNTFFQANPAVAEAAYGRIAEFAADKGVGLAIDAYSGTGVIAQLIAGSCGRVLAVENVPENVAIARLNIAHNATANVEITVEDALRYLRGCRQRADLVVVNPPRVGLGSEMAQALLAHNPAHLAYMSCNSLTLLSDIEILQQGYDVQGVTVFDMFPQTQHWEALVLFSRRVGQGGVGMPTDMDNRC